ncbi:multiple sugar transport system substrate-binding protein [Okibacterium sp. HSC-33S16]|uniref:extracellular solute-binding protein n=1 Tax=Okibacterium sp. HSC-33S16 TaxID=2910965 RepID=UPI0020A201DA|nr:extracellular solute-binding protein [Okibacterium sp. HSC-33S16]MCP2031395.1 multiple sugar transport system substrate-binding protein [Okibacterium sp. HSC-33S16]
MQRRTFTTATATAAVALLALTACSGGGASSSDALKAKGDITIWYSNNEQEVAWGKAMVEAWNKDHPDEQIKGQEIPAGKSSEEVIGAAITAGTAPCLVFNTAPSAVGQFQKQGGLVDLTKFDDGKSYIEERSGDAAEQYQSPDGGYFQMPWKSNPVMIFYNKDMFTAAGLDPEAPKLSTYDDFLATSKTLVESGAAPFAIYPTPTSEFFQSQFDFMPLYAAQTGGTGLVEDGKATFDSEDGLDVATLWKTLYDEGLAGKEQLQGDSFATDKAAMAIVGPWAIAVYGEDKNWGAVPVPTKDGIAADETYTFSDAKNVGLYSACKNQATAWEVLKFATSEEQDGQLLELTGQMPIRQDLPEVYADYFEANPAYTLFGDQASRTIEVPAGPNTVEMLQDFRDAYTKAVISGEGDLADALKGAADKVTKLAGQD